MLFQECELVPIPTLKDDLFVLDPKEPAAPQTERVSPLENSPLTVLENVLDDAEHLCSSELRFKHLADCLAAHNRFLRYLMVHSVRGIKARKGSGICFVEGLDPRSNDFTRFHICLHFVVSLSGACRASKLRPSAIMVG